MNLESRRWTGSCWKLLMWVFNHSQISSLSRNTMDLALAAFSLGWIRRRSAFIYFTINAIYGNYTFSGSYWGGKKKKKRTQRNRLLIRILKGKSSVNWPFVKLQHISINVHICVAQHMLPPQLWPPCIHFLVIQSLRSRHRHTVFGFSNFSWMYLFLSYLSISLFISPQSHYFPIGALWRRRLQKWALSS